MSSIMHNKEIPSWLKLAIVVYEKKSDDLK